jgi:serine/threonine protein kinase
VEVDAARLETLVGKPRFVAERSWTGVDLDGLVVHEIIGAGGMGTVYRAEPKTAGASGGALACKFLAPSLAAEPELVARFAREVALLEKLDHPGIVKVRGHGERDGVPWFAMDLVEGPTLAVRLSEGPLPVAEARGLFAQLLDALAHAHGRGVVHRDLKPANVLLAATGPRLADFGVAHPDLGTATRKTQLTRTDAIIGTFPYMSPEQRAGKPVDARSDLYSLGVMIYEALAGVRPEGAFRPLHERRSEVPARVDAVLVRLLRPDREDRYPTATEARRAWLTAWAPVRRRVVWAAAAAVGLLVAGGGGLALRERNTVQAEAKRLATPAPREAQSVSKASPVVPPANPPAVEQQALIQQQQAPRDRRSAPEEIKGPPPTRDELMRLKKGLEAMPAQSTKVRTKPSPKAMPEDLQKFGTKLSGAKSAGNAGNDFFDGPAKSSRKSPKTKAVDMQ